MGCTPIRIGAVVHFPVVKGSPVPIAFRVPKWPWSKINQIHILNKELYRKTTIKVQPPAEQSGWRAYLGRQETPGECEDLAALMEGKKALLCPHLFHPFVIILLDSTRQHYKTRFLTGIPLCRISEHYMGLPQLRGPPRQFHSRLVWAVACSVCLRRHSSCSLGQCCGQSHLR
jgi:hypothetical protein